MIVSAGFTIDSCLQVSDHLRKDGIQVRVINVINPNALNEAFGSLITNGRPLLTVYNGHPRILRQAVADALLQGHARPSVLEGVGFTIGTTGTFEEIRAWTKLDADGILCTAKRLL